MVAELTPRKRAIRDLYNRLADTRDKWLRRNRYYHEEDHRYMRFLVPEGMRVLELGCGSGDLLAALKPAHGVGVDLSDRMIERAKAMHPHLTFHVGDVEDKGLVGGVEGPFDFIILSDTIGFLDDCEGMLAALHGLCTRDTRIVISYFSRAWAPILAAAEALGLKMPQPEQNWLAMKDIEGLLDLADYDVVKREWRVLMPKRLLGLGRLVNRFVGNLPVIRSACVRNYIVARPLRNHALSNPSVTVVIPCRNERGNIEQAVQRLPRFCDDIEIIFVEGHSRDGTADEVRRAVAAHPDRDVKLLMQDGRGKGDAVRKAFAHARGDILMILDADLTVPPESLPRFYSAIVSGKGNFINGSRLVYPMERQAMRMLNLFANQAFAFIFTWLLNQRVTDTLCGTKVLSRDHYRQISANRSYFGDFDPFGDFDLIFGASKLNLKIVEIPIRYTSRRYGETQISRFRHGWLLMRMVAFAYRKLKAL